jgi:cAMP-dependent protein kinase regulator
VNGATVGSLTDGKSFGDLALLYNTPRQATITSTGHSQLFALDRDTFRYTLAKSANDRSSHIQNALSRVSLLNGLTALQLSKISEAVEIIKFDAGLTGSFCDVFLTLYRTNYHQKGNGRKYFLHDQRGNCSPF